MGRTGSAGARAVASGGIVDGDSRIRMNTSGMSKAAGLGPYEVTNRGSGVIVTLYGSDSSAISQEQRSELNSILGSSGNVVQHVSNPSQYRLSNYVHPSSPIPIVAVSAPSTREALAAIRRVKRK